MRTDADGRFRIAGLDEGAWVLVGVDPGVEVILDRPRLVPAAGDVDWTIASSGADRTLRVLADDDGSPIGGAEVIWATQSGEGEYFGRIRRLVSDAAGTVVVPAAAREGLRAEAPGFVPRDVSRETVGPAAGRRDPPRPRCAHHGAGDDGGRCARARGPRPIRAPRRRGQSRGGRGSRSPTAVVATRSSTSGPSRASCGSSGESVYSSARRSGHRTTPTLPVISLHAGETRTKDFVALAWPAGRGACHPRRRDAGRRGRRGVVAPCRDASLAGAAPGPDRPRPTRPGPTRSSSPGPPKAVGSPSSPKTSRAASAS